MHLMCCSTFDVLLSDDGEAEAMSAGEAEAMSAAVVLRERLVAVVGEDIVYDEICAACFRAKRQTEAVDGDAVLCCSFCNEVWHDRTECLGAHYPAANFTDAESGHWACPRCLAQAEGRRARRAHPKRPKRKRRRRAARASASAGASAGAGAGAGAGGGASGR